VSLKDKTGAFSTTATTCGTDSELVAADPPELVPPPPQALSKTQAPSNRAGRVIEICLQSMRAP